MSSGYGISLLILERSSRAEFVETGETLRFVSKWQAHLRCFQGILQRIGHIESTNEQVTGRNAHIHHLTETASVTCREFHASTSVYAFFRHGGIFVWLGRADAETESGISCGPPLAGTHVALTPFVVGVARMKCVCLKVEEHIAVALRLGCHAKRIGAIPLPVLTDYAEMANLPRSEINRYSISVLAGRSQSCFALSCAKHRYLGVRGDAECDVHRAHHSVIACEESYVRLGGRHYAHGVVIVEENLAWVVEVNPALFDVALCVGRFVAHTRCEGGKAKQGQN